MTTSIQPQSAYPNAAQIMNRARSFVNDSYKGGAGLVLKDTAAFTPEYLNSALEELEDRIRNYGVITLIQDNTILGPIPPVPAVNPQAQILLGYNGLDMSQFGLGIFPNPRLPSNLISVEKVWECQIGSGLPFKEMGEPMEGLPSTAQGPWFGRWEYRGDQIVLPGSTVPEQIRIRWKFELPIIAPVTNQTALQDVQIGILVSVNALATIVAYNFARARGAVGAAVLAQDAEKFTKLIINRYVRRAQGVQYTRRGYGDHGDHRGVRLPW